MDLSSNKNSSEKINKRKTFARVISFSAFEKMKIIKKSPASIVVSKPDDETKAEEINKMDPLEYFSAFLGIREMILKHLSSKDLITASEVSPSYYNFIASSKVLMEKIEFVFDRVPKVCFFGYNFLASTIDFIKTKIGFYDKSETHSEVLNLLKNSSRLYQSIRIRRSAGVIKMNIEDEIGNHRRVSDYVTNSELDFFCSKAHEWKNVSLENVYFRKKLDLLRLLSAIESSAESIFVGHFGVLPFEDLSSEIECFEALKFPNLKKLRVSLFDAINNSGTFGETLVRFLLNSVAIKELYLHDLSGKVDKDIITKMLTNFDKLKYLGIASGAINQIFKNESSKNFQFKLKSLLINLTYNGPRDHATNFLNFIKSQSDHLEELKITLHSDDKEIFDVIMKMPKLKSLRLCYFKVFFENELPNIMSTSIIELTLESCNTASLKYSLDSMPKVTNLTLSSINEEEFKILKSMNRKFEELNIRELKRVDRKEIEEMVTENYTSIEVVKSS